MDAIIIDDEPLVRKDLCYLLSGHPDIEIIGEAGTVPQAEKLLAEEQPDVVEGPRPTVRLALDDGMFSRWSRNAPPRVHFDTLRVYIDDERALLSYIPARGEVRATPRHDLAPGEHTVRLRVMNVWGNWSWPTQIPFTVE